MRTFIRDTEILFPEKRSDILFHVTRPNGSVDDFRMGDLAVYDRHVVTIVGIPDTVMGHFRETPEGRIICLDICTILIDGEIKNVQTEKVHRLQRQ